jgi:hypothetical protein
VNQGYIWETCAKNTVWDKPELPLPRPSKHGSRKWLGGHRWFSEPPNKELGLTKRLGGDLPDNFV